LMLGTTSTSDDLVALSYQVREPSSETRSVMSS
jgi:hypothetical protein